MAEAEAEKIQVELTRNELDLLMHFAEIGYNHIHVRNNFGDRAVAASLTPILKKLYAAL